MKKIISFIIVFLLFSFFSLGVCAKSYEFNLNEKTELYDEIYKEYKTDELVENSPDEVKEFTQKFGISPSDPFSFSKLFTTDGYSYMIEYIKSVLFSPLKFIGIMLISIIVCALASSMNNGSLQVNHSLNTMCALISTSVLLLPIISIIEKSVNTVNTVSVFMGVFIPIFAGILIACLKGGTAAAYTSVMFFTCEAVSYCCTSIVLPFANCYTALSVASGISGTERLNGIARILKKAAFILISASMAVFLAVLSVQSVVSSTADNAASKTAKFFISSFVPIIGPSISEALGSLKGCIGLLKSSAGIYAVIVILFMFIPLIIEIAVYKISLIFCSDTADIFGITVIKNICEALNGALSIILAVVLCVSLMFIFSITIISVTGGAA